MRRENRANNVNSSLMVGFLLVNNGFVLMEKGGESIPERDRHSSNMRFLGTVSQVCKRHKFSDVKSGFRGESSSQINFFRSSHVSQGNKSTMILKL
jgi:hypothetical protein